MRVAPDGRVIDAQPIVLDGLYTVDGAAWNGSAYAVIGTAASSGVAGVLVSPAGVVTKPATLLRGNQDSPHQPALAAGPDGSLLAMWILYTPPCGFNCIVSEELAIARVDASLHVLDEVRRPGLGVSQHPAAAWNGSEYLVLWTEYFFLYAQRMAADGTRLDPQPLPPQRHGGDGSLDIRGCPPDRIPAGGSCG